MSIKICHMTSVHNSDDIRIFQKECVSLAKNPKFEIVLVAPGTSRRESDVSVIGVGERPSNRLARMFSFTKKVYKKALEENADIYHFHDPELLKYGFKLKKKGKKVVFDSHEYTYNQILLKSYIPNFLRKIIADLYKKYEDKVCRTIDAVIFPCTMEGEHPFKRVANKTEIIGNVPDLSLFQPNKNTLKKFDICCTGSLSESRGITTLLKATKRANVSVALAGPFTSEKYREELEKQELLNHVTYFGYCKHSKIIDILQKSKICISNIKAEGQYSKIDNLPTKVYEAMAMKLPVIMSEFPYPKKLNKQLQFAMLIDPEDAEALYETIIQLYNNDEMRKNLGKNGRILVEKYFNWDKEAKKLEKLYLNI